MTTIRMARTMMTMRMMTTMTTTSSPSSLTVSFASVVFDLKETDFPVGLSLELEGEFSSSAPSVFSESFLSLSPLFSPAVSGVELV